MDKKSDDNDFHMRLVPIENGFLVKRLGSVWYGENLPVAIEHIQSLIFEWNDTLHENALDEGAEEPGTKPYVRRSYGSGTYE